jgi:hypothetical protein
MIEFMLATAILVGKAQIAPDKVQYDFINDNQTITTIIETNCIVNHDGICNTQI